MNAELDAAELLASTWFAEYPERLPVEPERIAAGLGIFVRTARLSSDESGNIVIPADRRRDVVITINEADHPNRQRFTCAHEIGHYVSRRERDGGGKTYVDYRGTLAGLGKDPDEIYANQFASALLMPAALVKKHYIRCGRNTQVLASTFGTSVQAMELRLRNLRMDA